MTETMTEETLVTAQVTISSTNTPSDIRYLMNTRNRTRDILQQIENILNVEDEYNFENPDISGIENNEFSIETDIENPFSSQTELSRTPPPEPNNYPEILEPLLPNISHVNTQEIIDRINTVIDREINSRAPVENSPVDGDEYSNEFGNEID